MEQMTEQQGEREITAKLVSEELVKEWEKKAEEARHYHFEVKFAAKTDLGRIRENNEDKFDFFEPEDPETLAKKGAVYAVCDGMGGHAAGQIASEMALKTIIRTYYTDQSLDIEGSLKTAIADANLLIYSTAQAIAERAGMGTTSTIAVVRGKELYVAQVGDSRAYMIRDGHIRQITEDHSWVAEQVKRGALTEAEAESSPFKNVITRSLGTSPTVEADVYVEDLQAGDTILLCSDGLSGLIPKDTIKQIVQGKAPSQAAAELIDKANENGGNDNITAVIVSIREGKQEEKEPKKRRRFFGGK